MTDRIALAEAVKSRLLISSDPAQCAYFASRAANCEEELLPNLLQWLNNEPLTDIYINEKYCIGAVMKIRRSDEFMPSFIALDDYAKDPDSELSIWQRWV